MDQVLCVETVTKRFGHVVAVDNISLTVHKGEIVSLLGPSGCGKTTTLRLIAGFEQPNSGTVRIAGEDMANRRPYERNVGLLFQDYALFPHMTVGQNVAYGLRHRGYRPSGIPGRVEEMLALVKLSDMADRRPGQLSGGQQQRVALARALATRPEIVLLDEPLSALDAKLRQELRVELKEILRHVGSTAVIVTHDQEEAMSMAERIIVMRDGRIVQEGTPDQIYRNPVNRFVGEFVGRSNWFSGHVLEEDEAPIHRIVTTTGVKLTIPRGPVPWGGVFHVCVRPERIEIRDPDPPERLLAENVLPGKLVDIEHLGSSLHFHVELASGDRVLVIRQDRGKERFAVGKQIIITFDSADCVVPPQGNN